MKARRSALPAFPSDFVQNYGCDQTVITGEGSEPGRVFPGEGGVQRALSARASMMATTGFLMFRPFAVHAKYQIAVIVSGPVTFIAAYLT